MTAAEQTPALRWAWDQQSIWSQAADGLKRSLFRTRSAALALTIVAAISATAAGQIAHLSSPAGKALAGLASVCAAVVALMRGTMKPDKVRVWMRARSVSEALKAETYTYLARVSPYRGGDREAVFKGKLDAVIDDAADLAGSTIGVKAVVRELPAVHDVDSYSAVRMKGQVDRYYRPKSMEMRRRAQWFRAVETGLAVIAAAISAVAAVTGESGWSAWLPVVTTITAAVAAEAAAQRYGALAVEYARTSLELERLLVDRASQQGPSHEGDDALVDAAERVISVQNEAWMARGITAANKPGPQPPAKP